ncbi:MAG: hypothetical protein PHG29_07790 [Prolixibacteraceae bacterium]|nr:hypothetical protein [Prolixibacteraceae bacterium]
MKTINFFLLFGFLILMISNSCDSDPVVDLNESDLTIEFSDGMLLTENEIDFYDSSTNSYFLKSDLISESPLTSFNIKVNNDSILGGVFHSCELSSPPPTPYYISDCFFSGRDILTIEYYGNEDNLLNDSRIINSLKECNKLRQGLSFQIDSIRVIASDSQTDVVSTVTIKNHDNIAYYIPDFNKMGERYYTDYTGKLSFSDIETGLSSFIKDSNSDRQRDDIKIDDLTKLKANSELTYTYKSRNYHAIPEGVYRVRANFMGIVYTASDFELNQDDGRIWVGQIETYKEGVIVE